jgi:two-component system sensor histidine kinase TctE
LTTRRRPSLRTRLLLDVLVPLLITWLLGTAVTVGVAYFFTQRAFDKAMLDDAYLLSSHLRMQDGEPVLNMSAADLNTALYDPRETEFYAIVRDDGRWVAGEKALPLPAVVDDVETQFITLRYQGLDLRAVILDHDSAVPLRIAVAMTTRGRRQWLNRLVQFAVLPQLALLMGLAVWLQRGIRRDLKPLSALQRSVEQRDAADLTPLPGPDSPTNPTREVAALGQSINALLARVDDGLRAQREFSGNVAHELRTPLAGIRAAAEYGLAQNDPQRWREQLLAVLHSQQRASHLVDQLLALALADEAHNSRSLRPVRLGEVAREVLLQTIARADKAGVDLGASGLDLPLQVMAEPALLEGLLVNLLDNALRYGGGADKPIINVDLREHEGSVWLSVTDNGPGIAPAQRQALRQRGAQGPGGVRLGVGAGLGLSIVERYAQLMRAELRLEDGPNGEGLSAIVVFPR